MARVVSKRTAAAGSGVRLPALFWVQGLICGGLLVFSPGTLLLFAAMFVPLLPVAWADRGPGRRSTRGAALFAAAATLHVFCDYWRSGASFDAALRLVCAPRVVLTGWAAIAGSWLVVEAAALGMRAGLDVTARLTQARYQSEIDTLAAEWQPSSAEMAGLEASSGSGEA